MLSELRGSGTADGLVTTIDAEPYLYGPVFEPLKDPAVFATVTLDPEAGAVVWPVTEADISPEELRARSRPVGSASGPDADELSRRFRDLPPMEAEGLHRDLGAIVDQRLPPLHSATPG